MIRTRITATPAPKPTSVPRAYLDSDNDLCILSERPCFNQTKPGNALETLAVVVCQDGRVYARPAHLHHTCWDPAKCTRLDRHDSVTLVFGDDPS